MLSLFISLEKIAVPAILSVLAVQSSSGARGGVLGLEVALSTQDVGTAAATSSGARWAHSWNWSWQEGVKC